MTLSRVWFIAAAWLLVRQIAVPAAAWLAAAMLVITVGGYGGSGVFHFAEDYLSARSFAEALIITALACDFRGYQRLGFVIAAAAVLVHPLMGLPGILLLMCLHLPTRLNLMMAAAGILAILTIATGATTIAALGKTITVIDPMWLEVVRERSQFLFPQLWSTQDWALNARPFVSLTLAAAVFQDPGLNESRCSKLCISTMLVAGAGLAVALIAGSIGPVAILIQGQAWRWIWIADFLGILLLVPTVIRMCRAHECGPICSLLIVSAWDFSGAVALLLTSLALLIWFSRNWIGDRMHHHWLLAFGVALVGILAWLLVHLWPVAHAAQAGPGAEPLALRLARSLMELRTIGLLVATGVVYCVASSRSLILSAIAAVVLLAVCIAILPFAVPQLKDDGAAPEAAEFADWVQAIPPSSSVVVADARNSGSFVWFTLGRPNYLTLSQSAGVVFSRETALEVRRRSEVLLPIMNPNWKVMTNNAEIRAAKNGKNSSSVRPLTANSLAAVCADPLLGFVISRENLGFDSMRHQQPGPWQDWNLYDCRKIRSGAGPS
jgi:hypothetical protein